VKCTDASVVPFGLGDMRENEGFGICTTARLASSAVKNYGLRGGTFAKCQHPADITELSKMVMLADGRASAAAWHVEATVSAPQRKIRKGDSAI